MHECVEQAAVFPKEEEGKSAILFRVCVNPNYNLTNLEKLNKGQPRKEKKCLSFGKKTTAKEYALL